MLETLLFGVQVALLGMGIVFVVLAFLIGIIKVLGMATKASDRKKPVVATVTATEKENEKVVALTEEENSEILAVISAAVAMMTGGNGRIVTINRVREEAVPGWASAGRQETMRLRQEL
jgi:sodium pump decarboxylase gamma subunit